MALWKNSFGLRKAWIQTHTSLGMLPWTSSFMSLSLNFLFLKKLYWDIIYTQITHSLRAHNSVYFRMFTGLCNHHHNWILECFHAPKRNYKPISSQSPSVFFSGEKMGIGGGGLPTWQARYKKNINEIYQNLQHRATARPSIGTHHMHFK